MGKPTEVDILAEMLYEGTMRHLNPQASMLHDLWVGTMLTKIAELPRGTTVSPENTTFNLYPAAMPMAVRIAHALGVLETSRISPPDSVVALEPIESMRRLAPILTIVPVAGQQFAEMSKIDAMLQEEGDLN